MYLEHLLTDEDKRIRETIREFVNKEIMPIRNELEEDYTIVEGIHQKLVDLGIQEGGYPAEFGGTGPHSHMALGIICEELAKGDAGISLSAGINAGLILGPAMAVGNKAVLERWAPRFCGEEVCYACLSMTDATGGADSENPILKGKGITTYAKLEGDEYVINGTKSWPTHAGIASVYLTVCTTDPNLGDEGIALIYTPRRSEGLSFGKPEPKMGFKTSVNASIYYDNVRVPKEYRLAGPGVDASVYHGAMTGTQWHSATMSLGTAQAAFDLALEYTGNRKSGGKPVREWSMAAGILADMAIRIEMTRGAVYNLSIMLDNPEIYGPPFSPNIVSKASVVKIFAADTGVWVTNKAAELMGSNGISPEYHLEKYLRDSKIMQLWLGGQQIARYRVARGYYKYETDFSS
jgi:alkylation response protein AidB-like acyl-CoA dehydrogenase